MQEIELTQEGYQKLKGELEKLVKVKRPQITARLQSAKDYGDLMENAEYETAKNDQAFIEGRIRELESILKNAKLIQRQTSTKIVLGSKVVCEVDGTTETYILVSSTEADPAAGKISTQSPLGKALFGKAVGEKVEVLTPEGERLTYQIIEVR